LENYDINNDISFIYNSCISEFAYLSNKSILLTGGSGFFGKWFIESISFANKKFNLNISLTVVTRDKTSFILSNPKFNQFKFLTIIESNLLNKQNIESNFDCLLHMATTTAHETFNGESNENKINTLELGTKNIIELAIKNKIKKILFTSSGIVYGPCDKEIAEKDFNNSIVKQKNSGLAQGKILAEKIITDQCKKYNINFKIARCFSFVGPYLPLDIHYAIGNFINDAVKRNSLILKSKGESFRSYLYIADTIIWLLKLLVSNEEGVFNVGSERKINIYDLAYMVKDIVSPSKDVVIELGGFSEGNFKRDIYIPNTSKIRESLGVKEWTTLEDSILKTAKFTS